MTKIKIGGLVSFLLFLSLILGVTEGFAASSSNSTLSSSCSSSFNGQGTTISSAGGTDSADITSSTSTCSWNVTSDSSWLSILSGGKGNGTLQYSASVNTGIYPRVGRLLLPNSPFSVTQSGTETYFMAAKWGSFGSGDGQFSSPQGISIDSYGFVYIVDSGNNRIQKFDSIGNFVTKWGAAGSGDGQFSAPQGIAIDAHGFVYIVDGGNNRIQKFDANGNFIAKWGTAGSGDGQFNAPFGIAAGPTGFIFVSDTGNNRIQKFDSNGNFIYWWVPQNGAEGLTDNCQHIVDKKSCHDIVDNRLFLTTS